MRFCNSFEIYSFKEEITAMCQKLMIVGNVGAVYYGFSEPDIA